MINTSGNSQYKPNSVYLISECIGLQEQEKLTLNWRNSSVDTLDQQNMPKKKFEKIQRTELELIYVTIVN
jgi:hypothetical protein